MEKVDPSEDNESMSLGYLDPYDMFRMVGCSISWCTFALSLLGVLTNAVSIYIYTHRVMRSPINVLLAGLSAIDLLLSACCIPSFVVPMWFQCYESDILETGTTYFTVYVYPFTMMAQSASVWTFLIIAFDRWIAVCHPLKARWSTIERSYRALITVSFAAVCYNAVRFFEYRLTFDEVQNRTQPRVLLKNDSQYPAYMPVYYVAMYLITHFIVPFSILICVNMLMILSIVKARRQRVLLGRKQKSEHKTTIMMGVVVFVFVLTNTLPFVLNFVEAVNPNYFLDDETNLIGFALLDFGNLLVVVNTSTTAFIYYACSQRYRRLFLYTCYKVFCGLKCFPFECRARLKSDVSAINGGYSVANASTSLPPNVVSSMAPTESLCSMAFCQFLPVKYRRAMSETKSLKSANGNGSIRPNRRGTVCQVIAARNMDDAELVLV